MTQRGWAAGYAEELLAPLGDRWAHVQGVVRQAQEVSAILPAEEREVLVAAAYLHDLGYAPALVETGFHALDGARHLRALGHERLAGLVAYHFGARCEAELRRLAAELAEFVDEASATSMTLTYCDMTTGPAGEVITYEERLAGTPLRRRACRGPLGAPRSRRGRAVYGIRRGTLARGRGVLVRRSPAEVGAQGNGGCAAGSTRAPAWSRSRRG